VIHAVFLGGVVYHSAPSAPIPTRTAAPAALTAIVWSPAPALPVSVPHVRAQAATPLHAPPRSTPLPKSHSSATHATTDTPPAPDLATEAIQPAPARSEPTQPIESAPATDRPQASNENALHSTDNAAQEHYLSAIKAWLEKYKTYPKRARLQAIEGEAIVSLTFNQEGRIIAQALVSSSGHDILDRAALDTLRAANPLPAIPPGFKHTQMTLVIPFGFYLM